MVHTNRGKRLFIFVFYACMCVFIFMYTYFAASRFAPCMGLRSSGPVCSGGRYIEKISILSILRI